MPLTTEQVAPLLIQLKSPGAVLRNGGFYLLYAHGRWHLMTANYGPGPNARQFIASIHFMSDDGAMQYLQDFISLPVAETVDQQFEGFAAEVAAKVLPLAQDYLPFFRSGLLLFSSGFTTDTTRTSKISVKPAVVKEIEREVRETVYKEEEREQQIQERVAALDPEQIPSAEDVFIAGISRLLHEDVRGAYLTFTAPAQ